MRIIEKLPVIIGASFILVACGSSNPASDTGLSPRELATTPHGDELAHPQPERPICDFCNVDKGGPVDDDDELVMNINGEYVGLIDEAQFVSYTPSDKTTFDLDQAVIDDLNDSTTSETVVMLDVPDIVRGLLIFTIDTETHDEPVRVFQ